MDKIKTKALPVLSKAGVIRSSLFGSVVRGEAQENSDVDLWVECPRGKTLLNPVDLKQKLERALGKPVDVVTMKRLRHVSRFHSG